jgi:hypothetical protein
LSRSGSYWSYHLNLSHPVSDGYKGVSIGNVIDQQYSLGTAEIRGGDGAESLLAGGIPYLCDIGNASVFRTLGELESDKEGVEERTCNLMRLPSNWIFLILKSMPMVVMNVGEKESFAYLSSRQVFPTPDQ